MKKFYFCRDLLSVCQIYVNKNCTGILNVGNSMVCAMPQGCTYSYGDISWNNKVYPLILSRATNHVKTPKNSILPQSGRRAMDDCILVKKMKQYEVVAKFNVHT